MDWKTASRPWARNERGPEAKAVEQALLEKVRLSVERRVGRTTLDSLELETFIDQMSREMVFRMTAALYAEEIGQASETVQLKCSLTTTVEVPDTWQDHFKLAYEASTWRGWAFRLFWPGPIIMRKETRTEERQESRVVKYRQLVGYPKLDTIVPKDQTFVKVNIFQQAP